MAPGREMYLTRQIGEHLVAAKLGRMDYVATPFAGNVPLFDLICWWLIRAAMLSLFR